MLFLSTRLLACRLLGVNGRSDAGRGRSRLAPQTAALESFRTPWLKRETRYVTKLAFSK